MSLETGQSIRDLLDTPPIFLDELYYQLVKRAEKSRRKAR